MKTSARFLAMLLAVLMIAGAALSVSAFDDVAGNKHANAINVLAQLKVIGGYEDGTFKPDQKVTRAEMAKLAYVLYTTFVDAEGAKTAFTDVADDFWATGYINWCSQQGIIGGYGDGTFGPNNNVTYDQALKMVCGVLGYTDFQSNLWPTDVRMKALRELNLGTKLDDVKGSEELTRAQVAQIMYNALTADMKETKIEYVYDKNSYVDAEGNPIDVKVPMEVAKQLATDVWGYKEVPYTVTGTENYGADATGKEDIIALDGTAYELEELGLEKYEGKTDALIGLQIMTLVDTDKKEALPTATVNGTVVDGVEVTYNKAEDTLTVNGVKYTAEKKLADELKLWTLTEKKAIKVAEIFTATKKGATDSTLIGEDILAQLDKAYMARVIDVEGDGEADAIVIVPKTAYTVTSLNKDAKKTVTLTTLDAKASIKPIAADLPVAVEKDDVVVVANIGGTYYVDVVEAVETYATKLTQSKVTLADGGEVVYDKLTVAGADALKLTTAQLGSANKTGYYVYDGELLLVDEIKKNSEYKFAILKEIIESEDKDAVNENFEPETLYTAVIIVDGKEEKLVLSSDEAIIDGKDTLTATEAYAAYKRGVTASGKKVAYKYTIVANYTEEDGAYTLTINKALNETTDIVAVEGTISYNATTGLYTVVDADDTKYAMVALDDNAKIYYTYTKSTTGDFEHIASYNKDTITSKKFTASVIGTTYLVADEKGETYTLLATIVKGEIKGSADDVIDYSKDGTLVLYAPVDAVANYDEEAEESYYAYTFMDNETVTNKEAVIDKTLPVDGKDAASSAKQTVAGKFYTWAADLDKYVEVKASADLESFKAVTIKNVTFINNAYYLVLADDSLIKLNDDITIWGLDATEEETNDTYLTFSAAELADMVALVNDYNTDNAETADFEALVIDAILVQVEDANDDFQLNTIIVNVFAESETDEDVVEAINSTIFAK